MSQTEETATLGPQPPPLASLRLRVGSVVADRYEIQEQLGRGGHATVYRAYDRLLKAEVALKVVHPERDPERALARIRREVGVARESLSPHLVRVFELGESDGDVYLTMEILAGARSGTVCAKALSRSRRRSGSARPCSEGSRRSMPRVSCTGT